MTKWQIIGIAVFMTGLVIWLAGTSLQVVELEERIEKLERSRID